MNRDVEVIDKTMPGVSESRNIIAVVGIDGYRAMPPLRNAVRDARGALRAFQELGFQQLTAPLLDEAATAAAMNRLVSDDLTALGTEDSLILFFAGHGTSTVRRFSDGVTVKTGYIVPFDATNGCGQVASWIKLDAWLDDVARLPAKHILVILDACHSGIALSSLIRWRGAPTAGSESFNCLRRRRSRRIITSALDDQLAMDGGPMFGHSLFTGCLIEALTGGLAHDNRCATTSSELATYLRHRVSTYPDSRQTPDYGTLALDDRGEMMIPILSGTPSRITAITPRWQAAST